MYTVGMRLMLEIEQNNQKEQYSSKLLEFNHKFLYVTFPTHQQSGKTAILEDGKSVRVSIVSKDNVVYRFPSEILGRKRIKKIPVLYIKVPQTSEIEKIQRRQYVRMDSTLDVAVHSFDSNQKPLLTRSVDISGGGLAVVTDDEDQFKPGERVQLTIVLPFQSDQYEYIEPPGEIIRYFNDKNNSGLRISIKFVDIKSEVREKIIKFIFEKQLEERRKLTSSRNFRRKRL